MQLPPGKERGRGAATAAAPAPLTAGKTRGRAADRQAGRAAARLSAVNSAVRQWRGPGLRMRGGAGGRRSAEVRADGEGVPGLTRSGATATAVAATASTMLRSRRDVCGGAGRLALGWTMQELMKAA